MDAINPAAIVLHHPAMDTMSSADVVLYHQTAAAYFLELADSHLKTGSYRDFETAADYLERAVAHAASAFGRHWHFYTHPTRRQIVGLLHTMARYGYISYNSARSYRKFSQLHCTIRLARYHSQPAPARRALRNSRRRTARIIASTNQAITDNPTPLTATLFD